jgi:transposase
VLFRKRVTRVKLLGFLTAQAPCVVAMEACAGAHYWSREIGKLGHHVRLIAPAYVKPFIKRQKNDAADAEAICEAAQRPSMRFVPVKTQEQQANGIVFRARDLLVRQRSSSVLGFQLVTRNGRCVRSAAVGRQRRGAGGRWYSVFRG